MKELAGLHFPSLSCKLLKWLPTFIERTIGLWSIFKHWIIIIYSQLENNTAALLLQHPPHRAIQWEISFNNVIGRSLRGIRAMNFKKKTKHVFKRHWGNHISMADKLLALLEQYLIWKMILSPHSAGHYWHTMPITHRFLSSLNAKGRRLEC